MENKKTGLVLAIVAAALGVLSFPALLVIGIFALVIALAGVCVGVVGIVFAAKELKAGKTTKSVVSLVLSIVGVVGGLAVIAFFLSIV